MNRRKLLSMMGALAALPGGLGIAGRAAAAEAAFREITWLMLVPKDWSPRERLKLGSAQGLQDNDPKARAMMDALREVLDTAPTVPALDGARVRLPGYMVPLEQDAQGLRQFLLVPYFGACIHTPPPPANQIVHVAAATPLKAFDATDAVWASGTLRTTRQDSGMAVSGYAMELATLQPYRGP